MDEELHQHLSRTHVFHEPGGADDRRGQVCFVLSRGLFDYNPGGFGYLLTEWGGELITMSGGGSSVRPRLREIGAPSIVVVALDLSHRWRVHASYPSLEKLFIGKRLGLEDAGSDVHYRAAVTGESILDIWQPGDPEYDRHSGLPR
jgi:hypothetical protein